MHLLNFRAARGDRKYSSYYVTHKLSVIRQKGESQNGCLTKIKPGKFFDKQKFLTPWPPDTQRLPIGGLGEGFRTFKTCL